MKMIATDPQRRITTKQQKDAWIPARSIHKRFRKEGAAEDRFPFVEAAEVGPLVKLCERGLAGVEASLCGYVAMLLCGSVTSYVSMWLCGYVALWLCGYMAIWLRGHVAMWLINDQSLLHEPILGLRAAPRPSAVSY